MMANVMILVGVLSTAAALVYFGGNIYDSGSLIHAASQEQVLRAVVAGGPFRIKRTDNKYEEEFFVQVWVKRCRLLPHLGTWEPASKARGWSTLGARHSPESARMHLDEYREGWAVGELEALLKKKARSRIHKETFTLPALARIERRYEVTPINTTTTPNSKET